MAEQRKRNEARGGEVEMKQIDFIQQDVTTVDDDGEVTELIMSSLDEAYTGLAMAVDDLCAYLGVETEGKDE